MARGEERTGVALEDIVVYRCQANDARMLGQGKLETIRATEALGVHGLDERLGFNRELKLLDTQVFQAIV